MSKKIIIIEDEAIIAADIQATLESFGYNVVGHEKNGDIALDLFARVEADLYLLDINIKGTTSGIALAKLINEKYHKPFIYLTSFADKRTVEEAKGTMPSAYIIKPYTENDLKVNVELALHKFQERSQALEFTKDYIEKKLDIKLSGQEYAVLNGFREGLTYKEIGKSLFISVNTVKTYQKRIFQILDVKSRFELLKKIES